MRPAEDIERLVKDAKIVINPDVKRDALKELVDELEKPKTTRSAEKEPNVWRIIMKSRTTKLAAAAVILIAALLSIYMFAESGVTLAGTLEKVEQATAFMYKTHMKMKMSMFTNIDPNAPPMDMDMQTTVLISRNYGMKSETITVAGNTGEKSVNTMYIVPDEKIAVMLMPDKKKYMEIDIDNDWLAKMKQQNYEPRQMIKQMMGCEYTELGRSTIDGVEVDGFQTTDPTVLGDVGGDVKLTLWVDAEKWLPLRSEIEFDMGDKMQAEATVSEFEWNIPVTADDFKPNIPDDYELMADGFKMPKINEEGLIEGLKLFAELAGSYPKKLSMMDLAQEMMGFMTDKKVLEKIKNKIPELRDLDDDKLGQLDKEDVMAKSMAVTQPLQSPGFFYMMLVQEKKEPVYYGETVGPDDVEAVLLRWKISDDKYRVIFGDLSAMDATAEQLEELEK
ncbi:MAG: hypothetical protein ACYS8Z_01840 [Planctomycetota bacterium]|jgi:archaellum component FlaF (FlaF/FlaG flagellin family)